MYLKPKIAATHGAHLMSRRVHYNRRCHNAGVGLIEVLISVLVMAIGLLGIAALQATALRNSQSALERSQAVIHSYSVLDAMRANLSSARTGAYNMAALVCSVPAAAGTLVSADQARWLSALQATMGKTSCGQISCQPIVGSVARECTITVQWDDTRGTGGKAAQQITMRTRL